MKACTVVRRDLSEYLDGELPSDRARALQEHLLVCSTCARDLEELRDLTRRLRHLSPPVAPSDLLEQVLEALDREHPRVRSRGGLLRRMERWTFAYPRVAAALMSFLITISLLGALLSTLRPIPEVPLAYHHASIALDARQYGLLNGEPGSSYGLYTFPRLRSPGSLDALFQAVAEDHLVVVTFVYPDGRARLVDVVAPSGHPVDLSEMSASFSGLRFEPAKRAGQHPVGTQLVMLLHRLEVGQ